MLGIELKWCFLWILDSSVVELSSWVVMACSSWELHFSALKRVSRLAALVDRLLGLSFVSWE